MAVFSTKQVHQMYVMNAYQDSTPSTTGDITAKFGDGNLYFIQKGKKGIVKSDYIPKKNIDFVKVTSATDLRTKLRKVKLELDTNAGAELIAGLDYIVRIEFRQFYGMSDQDVYIKDAAVHCTAAMVTTASTFWTALADALNKSFSREIGATADSNPYLTFTADSTYLTIEEKKQTWTLGTEALERVYFSVFPSTVLIGNDDIVWAKCTEMSDAVGNGEQIADLEYFCMGERGDKYRMMGWPNVIPTEYMVNASKEYDVVDIHYAFTDDGVSSYRSEKDITIAVPVSTTGGSEHTETIKLVKAIASSLSATVTTDFTLSKNASLWTWT